MKFTDEKKVIISSMDKDEAKSFLMFLARERDRHENEEKMARLQVYNNSKNTSYAEFWQTAEIRHRWDIEDLDRKVIQVKDMFGL